MTSRLACIAVTLLLLVAQPCSAGSNGAAPQAEGSGTATPPRNVLLDALARHDFAALDTSMNDVQKRFEEGKLSEIELRNAFRPFYKLNAEQEAALRQWPHQSPKSYSAHLALGIYFKKLGGNARGEKWISETSKAQLEEMRLQFRLATKELTKSEELTDKPYLSIFHLLDISGTLGNSEESLRLVKQANKMLPTNRLARSRYIHYRTPRWGGSYEEMRAFIAAEEKNGASQASIDEMTAIMYDDIGDAAWRDNNHTKAYGNFARALTLGNKLGGTFKEDWLDDTIRYMCSPPRHETGCP